MDEGDAGGDGLVDGEPGPSTPPMRIVPLSGATTPPRIFISVDLPAPFSPISASTSPFATDTLTWLTARTPG